MDPLVAKVGGDGLLTDFPYLPIGGWGKFPAKRPKIRGEIDTAGRSDPEEYFLQEPYMVPLYDPIVRERLAVGKGGGIDDGQIEQGACG